MKRVDLTNGIALFYSTDTQGRVIIKYPDGSQVQTTWGRLSRIETLIDHLRQAYESLLRQASAETDAPVETLVRIDDLLFALDKKPPLSDPAGQNAN